MAEALQVKGNKCMKEGKFTEAIDNYSKAIKSDSKNHILYSNRSAAFIRTLEFGKALVDANKCVELAPTWAKGFNRVATVYDSMGECKKAEMFYKTCQELGGKPTRSSKRPFSYVTGALLALRILMIFNALMYPLFAASFQRSLISSLGVNLLQMYQSHGRPYFSKEYAQSIVLDLRFHALVTSLLFIFSGHSRFLVMVLFVWPEMGYVVEYAIQNKYRIMDALSPIAHQKVLPVLSAVSTEQWLAMDFHTRWTKYNLASLNIVAALYVGTGFSLLLEIIFPYRSLMLTFLYWQLLRLRFIVDLNTKEVFKQLDSQVIEKSNRIPYLQPAYIYLRNFLAWMSMPSSTNAQ